MRRFIISLSSFSILVIAACSQEETQGDAKLASSVTVGASHISAISAVLAGKANLGSTVATDLKVGFQYSKSAGILPSNSTTVEASDADADYNYTTSITWLDPATTYYYRSFVRQNGQDTYGETKEFTTKDFASLLQTNDASDIEASTATINAKLDLTDVPYKSLSYGFLWGSSETALYSDFKCTEIKDNAFSAVLTGLPHKTQFWYKSYVELDSQTFNGEAKTFTTDMIPVESVLFANTEYTFHTIGNTLMLKATVLPDNATDKSVEWSSDKESVATVDQNGTVKTIGNGVATITVTTKDQGKTASCIITVAQLVTRITLSSTSLTLSEGQDQTLSATVYPDNAADKTLIWTSTNESVAQVNQTGKVTAKSNGAATIRVEANDGSDIFASCAVRVKGPYTAVAGEAVDLGLNVKWSSMNLGATSPTSSGDYFAWGEIAPKDNYNWESYELCNGSYSTLTRYNNSNSYGAVDYQIEFVDYDYVDDAARQALGDNWRIPTDADWKALRDYCTWTWATQNGVNGYLVTSKINGNSIFLPAAGRRIGTGLSQAGSYGYYWSSSLGTGIPSNACYTIFKSNSFGSGLFDRCYGLPIRPVTK